MHWSVNAAEREEKEETEVETVCCGADMAGVSNEQIKQLSQKVYKSLQTLGCPLVEGLCLREAQSMLDLLCTPSVHRTDILKWISVSICPRLKAKFDVLRKQERRMDDENNALLNFGYELMLCNLTDMDLIKGTAPPLRQLLFLERLISLVSDPAPGNNSSVAAPEDSLTAADGAASRGSECSKWTERLLRELMAHPSLLQQLQSSKLSPLPPSARALFSTLNKTSISSSTAAAGGKQQQQQQQQQQLKSVPRKVTETELQEARDQLQTTKSALEELQKQCEFLDSSLPLPTSPQQLPHSSRKLHLAATDLQHLMSTFGHIYYDFKVYCEKPPPKPPLNTDIFRTVGQLLKASNMELQTYDHLTDTSSSVRDDLTSLQTEKHFYSNGEMQSLTTMLESLQKKYTSLLSTPHDGL
ncbi:HAUS augmin-like complex subunit 7 [Engraulis encrasicolus]|uniref:HAUS augmin-like complex subunit 7 n=1 Tax=Engraulis encrasicolus TaxID=184585 RepID=UPI002FD67C1A